MKKKLQEQKVLQVPCFSHSAMKPFFLVVNVCVLLRKLKALPRPGYLVAHHHDAMCASIAALASTGRA